MDFLNRLDYLKKINGDTNASLSKGTGIPYTTIDSFYKKGWLNTKLSTLQMIAAYYHVTLDFLVGYDDKEDDIVKQNLLRIYEELSADGRQMLLAQAEFFREREKASKKDTTEVM